MIRKPEDLPQKALFRAKPNGRRNQGRAKSRWADGVSSDSLCCIQGPSITKKIDDFFFVYFGTHSKKIHTISKQTGINIYIFSMLLFVLLLYANSNNKKIVGLGCIYYLVLIF
jgi:hypothetical protein